MNERRNNKNIFTRQSLKIWHKYQTQIYVSEIPTQTNTKTKQWQPFLDRRFSRHMKKHRGPSEKSFGKIQTMLIFVEQTLRCTSHRNTFGDVHFYVVDRWQISLISTVAKPEKSTVRSIAFLNKLNCPTTVNYCKNDPSFYIKTLKRPSY